MSEKSQSRIPAPIVNSRWRNRATDTLYKVVAYHQESGIVKIVPLSALTHETDKIEDVPLMEWAEKYAIADIF